jgi:hypothetical protein
MLDGKYEKLPVRDMSYAVITKPLTPLLYYTSRTHGTPSDLACEHALYGS